MVACLMPKLLKLFVIQPFLLKHLDKIRVEGREKVTQPKALSTPSLSIKNLKEDSKHAYYVNDARINSDDIIVMPSLSLSEPHSFAHRFIFEIENLVLPLLTPKFLSMTINQEAGRFIVGYVEEENRELSISTIVHVEEESRKLGISGVGPVNDESRDWCFFHRFYRERKRGAYHPTVLSSLPTLDLLLQGNSHPPLYYDIENDLTSE
ncbi:hypothetical protein KSP39_PZI002128 [Platanthera zijinensis]|uniref:Uncharacterized protein n=1 Tax=Platanthera zijinensis TaxID=2320716 RepID=A0AAP0BZU7_9ASPA